MLDSKILEICKSDVRNLAGFDRLEFVSADLGSFVMKAHPALDCSNEYGNVHGGFLLAMADMAAAGAADTYGRVNVTMSASANFLRPVRMTDEYVLATATAVHAGRRSIVVDVVFTRPDGEVVLKSVYTMAAFDDSLLDVVPVTAE